MEWTEDRVDYMIALRNERLYASQIASLVGVSRSAVIGKLSRLGYSVIGKPRAPYIRPPRWIRPPPRPDPVRLVPVAIAEISAPASLNIQMADLAPQHCRWPYGNSPYLFCGHGKQLESCYCPYHDRMAHKPRPERHAPPKANPPYVDTSDRPFGLPADERACA